MRRLLLPLTLLLVFVLAQPAGASRTQSLTFEAPRDLMNAELRAGALHEIDSFGVRSVRVIVTWKSVAPGADKAERPDFEPTDPGAYDWGEYEPLMAAIKERGWSVLMTISGPGAGVGDAGQARRQDPSEPVGVRRVRHGRRAQVRRRRSTRGRSGTSPTSPSSCARSTPAAARRRRRRSIATSTSPASAG